MFFLRVLHIIIIIIIIVIIIINVEQIPKPYSNY